MYKTKTVLIIFVLFSLQTQCLFAYDEPDNFAGLKFGEDLTAQIAECPYIRLPNLNNSKLYQEQKSVGQCYAEARLSGNTKVYTLHKMGDFQKYVHSIYATQLDGKLVAVELTISSSIKDIFLSMLIERYGKPTEQLQVPWTPKAGVQTTSFRAVWKGKAVIITLDEHLGPSERGLIRYETPASIAERQRSLKESINKGAGGL